MTEYEAAVAAMDKSFGSPDNVKAVLTILRKNAEAKVIYDCAIRAIIALALPDAKTMADRLDQELQERGIFGIGWETVTQIVAKMRECP